MATGVDLSLSGLASGFDWKAFVEQMVTAQRVPQTALKTQQNLLQQRNSAFGQLATLLTTLQDKADILKEAGSYDTRTVTASDTTTASANAADGTALGNYSFFITQLATASKTNGESNVGAALDRNDLSGLSISDTNFSTAITAGTFSINGHQITVETSDTLTQVFSRIAEMTGNEVIAGYDSETDKITLSSSSEIVLGTATDTSNFLQATRLSNNGTGSIASSLPLGSIRLATSLATAGFSTPVANGESGAGEFKINGVSIEFNATTDTVTGVLGRINNSTAGVNASYDAVNDRFILTNKLTGDMGVSLEDVSGNFLAATGLSAGALARGKNLVYTLNGSEPLTSQSNTITEATSGITGLSVTALKENASVTVTVGSDTSKIKTGIQAFVDAYNKIQSAIDSLTTSSTSADGKVTAGLLANDSTASDIASQLRSAAFSSLDGLAGNYKHLADLGYQTNGYDNQLVLSKPEDLDTALATGLVEVKQMFTDVSSGFGAKLSKLVDTITGDGGSLKSRQDNLTKGSSSIDAQIASMEKYVLSEQKRMTADFVAMETAQAKINEDLAFLEKTFT